MKTFVEKFTKTEFFVTIVAMLCSTLAKKFGIPDEELTTFILSTTGLAFAYIGGRSAVKVKGALKTEVEAGLLK